MLVDRLLWLYFKANKRFLAAFSETLIGDDPGPFKPDGKAIVQRMEEFMRQVSPTVFRLMVAAVATLPLAVPPWPLPKESLRRELRKLWFSVRSHFARLAFLARGRAGRKQMVDTMFKRLAQMAPEQQDDAIKTIVTLTFVKGVFSSAYLDEERIWKALQYAPYTTRSWSPPSG